MPGATRTEGHRLKILVVDDEAAVRSNLARMLRLEGFEVIEASEGRTALELAVREQPDLVISGRHDAR